MSKYMKKNEKKNKKKKSYESLKVHNEKVFVNNIFGCRKVVKETKEEFIYSLYGDSEKYKQMSRYSNTVTEHEIYKALSLYAKDTAKLLDAWLDRYTIV